MAVDCPEPIEEDTMSITAHEVSVQHAEMFIVPSSPPREEFITRTQSLKGSWNPDDFSYQECHLYETTVQETV